MNEPERPRATGRLARRIAIAYGLALATIAVAALVAGALALRDSAQEQHRQTQCARASALADQFTVLDTNLSGKTGRPKQWRDYLNDLRVNCTS
jgi:hypothetical protein